MLREMTWLPPPPADMRARLKALAADAAAPGSDFAEQLMRTASFRLDESQLTKLGRAAAGAASSLTAVKLAIIGDGTLSLLGGPLTGSGVRHGLLLEIIEGGYNAAVQDATDQGSVLHRSEPDMVLIALDRRLAGLERPASTPDQAEQQVAAALARVEMIVSGLKTKLIGPVLVQTIAPPVEPIFGNYDRVEAGSVFAMVEAFNRRLAEWARRGEVVLVDIARLAGSVGLETWDAPGHWHASKLSFAPDLIPLYSDVVARAIGALKGKAKKALVLDLDNTLWGGVIGDDGVEGIALGQGSATGEAFLAIQNLALDLRARGVVLAVCSKNEEAAARSPFREHPDMLLKEEHIAVFQANWTDKAANLRAIAETLNIGVDALVFLDDNPFEREQVRAELPMVGVPEVGSDPALYPRILAAAGYFEAVAFTDEDRARAEQYQANAQRAAMLTSSGDIGEYLASLDMVCTIGRVDRLTRPRVAQLINKSNQFNLTTRRYTEQEVAELEQDSSVHPIQIRLVDRFGDNGIISVIVARALGEDWEIDTWLMSCRVLGRGVETAALSHLVEAARRAGARSLIGRYFPTKKNIIVADHYAKLGFQPAGETDWRLSVQDYTAPDLPMTVIDHALEPTKELAA
jgi:FkbH-like protein